MKVNKTNEVIEGYTELWNWWISAVADQAKAYADAMAEPSYDAEKVLALARGAAKLANEAVVRTTVEYLDMLAIYSSNMDEPDIDRSKTYKTKFTEGERTLATKGKWKSITTGKPLDPSCTVRPYPTLLHDGDAELYVCVDNTAHLTTADVYEGKVDVLDAAGKVRDTVIVQIGL